MYLSEKLIRHKKKITITSTLALVILAGFIIENLLISRDLLRNEYGLNPLILAWTFGAAEIIFNVGIVLMLAGSGAFKIKWKDIRKFDFGAIKFKGPITYAGFTLNRAAAALPWVYVLAVGWNKLPLFIILLILLELSTVLLIGLTIRVGKENES